MVGPFSRFVYREEQKLHDSVHKSQPFEEKGHYSRGRIGHGSTRWRVEHPTLHGGPTVKYEATNQKPTPAHFLTQSKAVYARGLVTLIPTIDTEVN